MSEGIYALIMPKYGMVMTEGVVAAWHVEEGSDVQTGTEIADIETEKIANVYECPTDGALRRRVAAEGETVPVGGLFGIIAQPSVSDSDIEAFIAEFQSNFVPPEPGDEGPTTEMIDAGTWRLRFLKHGEDEGAPLVLVHGFGGDLNNWMFNHEPLAAGRTVYALDLPGHGGSQKSVGAGDVATLASAVLAFLDAAGIDRAHLAGHSLGGGVALYLALESPARVASATLISPIGLGPEINAGYIDRFIEAGKRKEMKAVLQQLFADPELVSRDMVMEVLKAKRIDGAIASMKTIAGAVFAGGSQALQLSGRMAELAAPVQVIWGAEDRIVPVAHAETVPAGITVHRVEGAGHMAHMEGASEVNRLIEDLIATA
jgi:pyruvate dehydrogenase E2 component (dihydrolipoamide acetyltransferase)